MYAAAQGSPRPRQEMKRLLNRGRGGDRGTKGKKLSFTTFPHTRTHTLVFIPLSTELISLFSAQARVLAALDPPEACCRYVLLLASPSIRLNGLGIKRGKKSEKETVRSVTTR